MEGWQPIESAPKDGTFVLCAWPKGRDFEIGVARWQANQGEDGWIDEDGGGWWGYDDDGSFNPPTHWMPLPDPPSR